MLLSSVVYDLDINRNKKRFTYSQNYNFQPDGSQKYSASKCNSSYISQSEIFFDRFFSSSSSKTEDILSLGLEQYDSFAVLINGDFGLGGALLGIYSTNDGTITASKNIYKQSSYIGIELTGYRYLKISNTVGGKLNTVSVCVIKMR